MFYRRKSLGILKTLNSSIDSVRSYSPTKILCFQKRKVTLLNSENSRTVTEPPSFLFLIRISHHNQIAVLLDPVE